MKKLNRKCPICKCGEGILLHTQTFILENDNPLPSNYDVVCCGQCTFVFADTMASKEDYDTYYQSFSKYESAEIASGGGDNPFDRKRIENMVDDILPYLDKNNFILDIGAARGGVLNVLKHKGYHNLYAVEPSGSCVEHMKNHEIISYQGTLYDNLDKIFQDRKFDFIILSHVLEHIYDLELALKNISSILSKNGKVYIEVPDAQRYKDFFVVPYYYFDIEHINHFDQYALQRLFSLYGFKSSLTKHKNLQVTSVQEYPVVFGIFQKTDEAQKTVMQYIEKSKEDHYTALLTPLIRSNHEVVIWGAGNFTKRLLGQNILNQCNIKFFVDKDEVKQRGTINDIHILPPEALKGFNGTIIVASALFSHEIVQEIRQMHLRNDIIILK